MIHKPVLLFWQTATTVICNIELPLNVEASNQINLTIFPNPASSFLYIETTENFDNYTIISAEGKLQASGKLFSNKIDVNDLSSGLYYLQISNLKGNIIGVSSFVKL